MNVKEVRLARLRQLLEQHGNSKAKLAVALKKAPAQVSQWFNGVRQITEDTARELERNAKLPDGWLDRLEDENAGSEEKVMVLDEALRSLGPDARREALDFIRYKLERAGSHIVGEELARYNAALDALDANPQEKKRRPS
jgi:transcriptional regulator with XRE-family HTH domain